jgi:hypothetical protein
MARTLASIKRRHYRVLHRAPAAYTRPTTSGNFTTFLATFTELGYCRDKTIKVELTPAEKENLDTGAELNMGFNGHLEFILLQSTPTDFTAYEAIEGVSQDLFFYSEVSEMCIFVPTAILSFKESMVSGEIESIPAEWNATNLATKAAFRDRFAEPA